MSKKNLLIILALYIVSAASSYGVFAAMDKSGAAQQAALNEESAESKLATLLNIDPNEAVDQACPLNGKLYTKTEKTAWEARRPLFVMIENTPDARPQSGLSSADVVFEAIAEGGVTRFGALFYCEAQASELTLAPIRSARTYFVDWASGFNFPMYVHVGGANVDGPTDALGQIADYGWDLKNDINQFSVGYPTFVRNYNRIEGKEIATEHTMETSTEKLWDVAAERGWNNLTPANAGTGKEAAAGKAWQDNYTGWTFETATPEKGQTNKISYDFWSGYTDYSAVWDYDATSDTYKRSTGGEAHSDLDNGKQIAASDVIVLLTVEKGPINEKKHMLYTTIGRGKALIFKHGQSPVEANWTKATREGELKFVDVKGKDVELAPGMVWISVVSDDTDVSY
jgi:hypothetical protein